MDASWLVTVGAAVSVYAVMGVGAVARRTGLLTEEADHSLFKLIINVLMPCLIFTVVSSNPALKSAQNLVLPPLVGFGTVVLGFGIALLVTRLGRGAHGMVSPRQYGTFALIVGLFNYGYVPLPLVELLFDTETLGVLFVHNIGVELALWTCGLMLLSGKMNRDWWRHMLNAPSLTILAALAVNFTDASGAIPDFAMQGAKLLGQAAIPLSLILVGATMADQLRPSEQTARPSDRMKTAFWGCLLRLGALPLAALLLVALLPASVELKRVVIIEAAMPSATFPIVLARHYGGHPGTAMLIALSTSLVSLATIPLWIPFGMRLLGVSGG